MYVGQNSRNVTQDCLRVGFDLRRLPHHFAVTPGFLFVT